jgi:hypothetical protein
LPWNRKEHWLKSQQRFFIESDIFDGIKELLTYRAATEDELLSKSRTIFYSNFYLERHLWCK